MNRLSRKSKKARYSTRTGRDHRRDKKKKVIQKRGIEGAEPGQLENSYPFNNFMYNNLRASSVRPFYKLFMTSSLTTNSLHPKFS